MADMVDMGRPRSRQEVAIAGISIMIIEPHNFSAQKPASNNVCGNILSFYVIVIIVIQKYNLYITSLLHNHQTLYKK